MKKKYLTPKIEFENTELEPPITTSHTTGKPGHGWGDGGHTGPPGHNKNSIFEEETEEQLNID